MASSLDRVRRDLLAGRVETVNTGAVSGNAARVRSLQNRAERDQRFADYMDRVDAGEVLTREEIDDMRQSRTDTGRQMQQDYYRRQAEAALAEFERNERARQWDAELAERHGFHEAQEQRRIDEELRAARRAAYTDPDYRAYNREVWKDTQRPTSDLRYSQQQTAAVQRQRDRLTSGNSYLGRQYAQQEQAMSDNMRRPSDFMNPSQDDLNAAAQYRDVTERYQNTLDRLNNEAEQAQRQLRTVAEPIKEANDYELQYRGTGNPVEAARALESVWNPNRYSITDRDGTRIARDVYNSVNGVPGQEQMDVRIDQMSDAEKATVLNMAQAGKWSDIEKYTNDLQATLDARWYDTQSQRIAQMPKAAQVGYGMLGTVTAPAAYAQVAADTLLGRYTDPRSGAVGATRLTQEARERSLENAGTVGRFAGNVAYSMADNLVTMALGPTGAVVWLGLSAGGNEAANALANGATQRQAFAKGTTSGAIEAATEKIGIDNLFDTALKSGSRGIKNALKDIAKQFGSEGAEEIISEFANTFADKAIMGQQSEYNNAIRDYEASGLSHDDAVKRANFDFFVKNPGLAGLAGALSGALFGVGGVATQRIRQGASDLATGRDITNNRQIADVVLDEGMKSTDERIKALSYALDTVRQENRNSEGFQWSKADLREIGEVYDSLDDAAKKRISDDYAERERTRQEEEAERVRAREAEIQAEQDARAREDAQRALAEREAETDRIVEDAEAIDLDNPEALTETTIVDDNKAGHTETENRTIEEYKNAVDKSLLAFIYDVDAARAEGNTTLGNMSFNLGNISDRTANAVQAATGIDVSGFRNDIDGSAIQHIENRHGETGEADRSMRNAEDIARMQYVIDNFDECNLLTGDDGTATTSWEYRDKNNKPAPMVRFGKQVDGRYFVVEAVPDSKRRTMHVVSAYMQNNSGSVNQVLNMPVSGTSDPQLYVQNAHDSIASTADMRNTAAPFKTSGTRQNEIRGEAEVPSENTIPQNSESVNPTQQRRDMKKQVREVYSSMGITSEVSVGEIADAMQEAYNAIREKGDGSESLDERKAFLSAAQEHFEEDMLRQAEEDRDRQFGTEDEVYTQARKTIRGTRLYVPQSLNASELGVDSFNEFRRANFGVLNLTRDSQAMPIDTFYDELVREYPGLFPDPGSEGGPTSEADMLRTIAEVYRSRGSAMQAEPIDTDAINAESKRKAMELYRPMVEAAQQAYTTAQTTARQNAEQAGQTTANNARRAGLSAADSLALSNVARDLGVGLEFRKMKYGRVNGFYNRETNTVVLNQDLSTAEMAWTTFAHEIVHAAETAGNYQQLADIAKRISVKDADKGTEDATWRGTVDELRRVYAQEGFRISRESAEHEAVTNILQDVLGSREALEGVARESKTNGRALLSDVDNVLDRTTTNNAAITPEAARLAEAQKALAAALNDAQENARYTASVPGQQVEASISGINMDEIIKTAVEKYGRMRSGEQLVNAKTGEALTVTRDDIANKTSDETRTRSGYRTMAETKYLSDLAIKDLAALDQYTPTSNEKNLEAARKLRAESVSLDGAFEKLHERLRNGSFFNSKMSENLAFAELLLQEASQEARKTGNEKYVQMANQIAADIAFIGTEAGQTVQVMSLMKRLSPEGQLEHVQRIAQDYSERHGIKKGKVPKDVQTVIDTLQINDELLDKIDQLKKLKKLEANGGKITEDVARQIADLEAEIEQLNKELEPLRKKLAKLNAERAEDAKEAGLLKREKTYLEGKDGKPGKLARLAKEIYDLVNTINQLNEELGPKRTELQSKLAQEGLKRAERNQLARELRSVENQIKKNQELIWEHQQDIVNYMAQMSVKEATVEELQEYERVLSTSKEIMQTYKQYVKNKGGEIDIPLDLQTAFINAKTEQERDVVRLQIDQAIAEQMPGTRAEKIRAWRYMSMLANPTTHFRNILGNGMQYVEKGFRDTMATGLEAAFMKKNAELYQQAVERVNSLQASIDEINANKEYSDEYKTKELKRLYESMAKAKEQMRVNERSKAVASRFAKADKAYYDAAKTDYAIIKKDLQAGGRAAETQHIDELRDIFESKALEKARKFAMNLLETEDEWFLNLNYTQSFAEYLKANNIDPASMNDAQLGRARARAFQEALEATYRDASAMADAISKFEHMNTATEFFVGGVMPFKKTPINILKRGVEYSPLGIVRAVWDDVQMHKGKNTRSKTDILSEYAEGLTGSILYAAGAILGSMGVLTATGGDDEKDREKALDNTTGYQNYALRVVNKETGEGWTYTFDWLMPAAMSVFAGTRAVEIARDFMGGKFSTSEIIDSIIGLANPIFELSMLDGVASLFKNYASDDAGIASSLLFTAIESYALQYVPTFGGKLARTIDPYQRSTYSPKDSPFSKNLERLYRRAMAKIPGASYMLEPVIDQYGNPKENVGKNFIGRLGYNLTSPGYYKNVTALEPDKEMKRLYETLGEDHTDVLPKAVPTYISFQGDNYYLDAKEYRNFSESMGKEAYSELEALYASQEYKSANDTMKGKMVSKVWENAYERAKRSFFEDIGLIDDYYRHELDGLVYDDTQGYRQYKTIPEATEIYEQGRIDLKTVYDANETLKGISGNAARIDAMNKMNLDSDEYNFLYMTKIASNEMETDISAVINAGGSLDRAVNIVSQFYKWDANAENKTTGEKGAWVSIGNGAKAEVLAQSNMTPPAIETMYLRVLTPADDVEKQTELINEFKSAGKNIKDYLNTKAVLYDGGVSKYKKTSDIAQAFLDSDLPDDLKELGYKTLGSDAQGVPDEIAAFKKARMTIDDYLRTKAVVGKTDANGSGLKNYEKARELLKMDLKSYTAAITSVITSSENQATGIQNCLNAGISDRKVAEGYAKYAEINANDALNATQKATEFSKWLNTDSSMSGLTTAQQDMMRASFVYFMMTPASAGRYDNLMKLDGMTSKAAESISADIAKLEPKEGSKSVSDLQRLTAVAYNSTASEKQIDLAMQQILDSSDDGTDTAGLTKYRAIRAAGMSAKQYVDFRTNTESITSDKDSNGKDIKGRTRQDKIWAYINSLPISSKQKDALHLVYYKESTLSKTPWH